jgi:hypothetical protein
VVGVKNHVEMISAMKVKSNTAVNKAAELKAESELMLLHQRQQSENI